ncbi:hypothetical protein [Streptomyces sp. NPDC017991]|uniref:hypothetical protein n=1 Tax=Streptomyces sp. NPDC017991 TaxID=3365026 RepID=UPI0037BAFD8B
MSLRRKARSVNKGGRRSLLNEDVEGRIIVAARTGIAIELAAEAAGISSATYRRWMARGRA